MNLHAEFLVEVFVALYSVSCAWFLTHLLDTLFSFFL